VVFCMMRDSRFGLRSVRGPDVRLSARCALEPAAVFAALGTRHRRVNPAASTVNPQKKALMGRAWV